MLEQLAATGITPDQAAQEIRRFRTTRQDRPEARRAALNEREQNEVGGILGRLGISPGDRTLDPRRREPNYAWRVAELHRRVAKSGLYTQTQPELPAEYPTSLVFTHSYALHLFCPRGGNGLGHTFPAPKRLACPSIGGACFWVRPRFRHALLPAIRWRRLRGLKRAC
jgi:hypothetical protein